VLHDFPNFLLVTFMVYDNDICSNEWQFGGKESQQEKHHLKDQGVDGKMGSKWTLGRLVGGGCGVDSPGLG
jgi:hypothetical protein